MKKTSIALVAIFVLSLMQLSVLAQDEVFSGPQVGEAMGEFKIKGYRGELDEQEIDIIKRAKDGPVALFLMHEISRPGFGLARAIGQVYAAERAKKGLVTAVVFMTDDPTSIANPLNASKRIFPDEIVLGVSSDGAEGPGAYGLNRKVSMTVLVGKEGKVVGNFALVQPSIPADGPKIIEAMAKALGEKPMTKEELMSKVQGGMRGGQRMQRGQNARGQNARGQNARGDRAGGEAAGRGRSEEKKEGSGSDGK